jgi:lysophospholipase L1-like esterase
MTRIRRFLPHILRSLGLLFLLTCFVLFFGLLYFIKSRPDDAIDIISSLRPMPTPIAIQLKGIGVIGDSQSDEYSADDNRGSNYQGYTLNWVEQLAQNKHIDFGKWQYWEEPRREGYAYDFARSGATTESMIESSQHTGLAEYVKQGKVNVVVIYIGANDFAPNSTATGYQAIYDGDVTSAALSRKENDIVANITTAIDVIQKAGDVHILLINIPDWGRNPGIQLAFPFPSQRQSVTDAIVETNRLIDLAASQRGVPYGDPGVFLDNIPRDSSGNVTVAGVRLSAYIPNNDPKSVFLDDGIHLGTVMNGLFANYIASALNSNFGTRIRLFGDTELLRTAGLK